MFNISGIKVPGVKNKK